MCLGLRYQNNRVPYEINGRFYNFDPATGNLVVPDQDALGRINPGLSPALRSRIVTAQSAGFPGKLVQSQNGWNPRIGIAYRGFKDYVVRAGYGVYNHLVANGTTGNNNIFSAGAEDFTNALVNNAPLFDLSNPFPSGTGGGTRPVGGISAGGINRSIKTPRTDQWNLSVDREIFLKFGLRTSYVGSKTTHATYRRNINLPPPSTIPFTSGRLIYPAYTGVTFTDSGGNVSYHALDIEARRSLDHGIYLNFGYTLAKQMTDVDEGGIQGTWGSSGALGPVIQNPYNRAGEKSNAHAIPRHFLKAVYTWDFPVGKGRTWLNNPTTFGGAVLDRIVGGWTFTGTGYAHSGWWFTPFYSGFDSANTGQFTTRPDRVGSGKAANRTPTNLFQVSDFVQQPAGRYGNSAPRVIEGLGAWKMDMGAYKSIALTSYEKGPELRIGMTSSNIFNHPNKAPWMNSAWLINSPRTVGIADDYYYDSVVSGGLGAWRFVRFDVSVRF